MTDIKFPHPPHELVVFDMDRYHKNYEYCVSFNFDLEFKKHDLKPAAVEVFELCKKHFNIKRKDVERRVLNHFSLVLRNLYKAWLNMHNPFVRIPLATAAYRGKGYSRKHMQRVLESLTLEGLITFQPGYYNIKTSSGKRTRIRLLPKLATIIIRHELPAFTDLTPLSSVELRGPKPKGRGKRKGKPIDTSRNVLAQTAKPFAQEVDRINNFLELQEAVIRVPEVVFIEEYDKVLRGCKDILPTSPFQNRVRRIFNDDFDHGGRFYCHWIQNLPKVFRRHTRINGYGCCEVDFKSIHPNLLYLEKALPLPENPYSIPGYEGHRPIMKLLFNIAINAPTEGKAINAARKKIQTEEKLYRDYSHCLESGWLKTAYAALKEHHKAVAESLGSGSGLRLQKTDSDIAALILNKLMKEGIPALPIHDSFIVPVQFEAELRQAMQESSLEITGKILPISKEF